MPLTPFSVRPKNLKKKKLLQKTFVHWRTKYKYMYIWRSSVSWYSRYHQCQLIWLTRMMFYSCTCTVASSSVANASRQSFGALSVVTSSGNKLQILHHSSYRSTYVYMCRYVDTFKRLYVIRHVLHVFLKVLCAQNLSAFFGICVFLFCSSHCVAG